MTRKEALQAAVEIIESVDTVVNKAELIEILKELEADYPYWKLNQKTVIDMVEQFRIDNNGICPHVNDFDGSSLPSPSVIKRIFHVSKVSDFLDCLYPDRHEIEKQTYNGRTHNEWLEEFKTLYLNLQEMKSSVRAADLDKMKIEGAPTLNTMYKWYGLHCFEELTALCGIDTNLCADTNIVNFKNASEEKMDKIISKIEEISVSNYLK